MIIPLFRGTNNIFFDCRHNLYVRYQKIIPCQFVTNLFFNIFRLLLLHLNIFHGVYKIDENIIGATKIRIHLGARYQI